MMSDNEIENEDETDGDFRNSDYKLDDIDIDYFF